MIDSNEEKGAQPGLFDPKSSFDAIDVLKYALGDFQDRGFDLAGRELALDRLLGALKRAYIAFDIVPLKDDAVAETLRTLGAHVDQLPGFVAKHPYRVTVPAALAEECLSYFCSLKEN